MPIPAHQVKRYRGKEIVLLRRLEKVVDEINRHQTKYPEAAPPAVPNRRHLKFTIVELAQLLTLANRAVVIRNELWPPEAVGG